ncbi:nitroreductase family protein [Comamonas jiangduensis]|uniref:nitroreductase family protein n=1 Tax=Comamonas jiangduensis TaxID=1194168 RepID=UPI003BF8B51F
MTVTALQARYGDAAPALNLPELPVLDAMLSHRSVRHFVRDALPEHTLETLVAAAQSAPTSSNLQTWSVIAVESQERREALANLVGPQKHLPWRPWCWCFWQTCRALSAWAKRKGVTPWACTTWIRF